MPARQNTSPSHRSRSATATAANTLMASRSIRQAASVPPVAFVSFNGSARVGWSLHHKLAPGTRSALEHGGVAPAIVDRSADLGRIIEPMVKGGYYHAGQVCVSTQLDIGSGVRRREVWDETLASHGDVTEQVLAKLLVSAVDEAD